MGSRKQLLGLALLIGAEVALGTPPALAEPLTPPAPNEIRYLDQLRKVFAASHDPTAFRSDGELLTDGHFVCANRDAGLVGQGATFQTPAVTQLAFIYLCP